MDNAQIVATFIEQVWNQQNFELLDTFLHPEFKDHSLPPVLPADKEGMKQWIIATGKAFEHTTAIEEQVTEGDKCMIKVKMSLKHIGTWRGLDPTGAQIVTTGYRYYRLKEEKIIEHDGLINGEAIEAQIRNTASGCEV